VAKPIHIEHHTRLERAVIRVKLGEVLGKVESKFNLTGTWSGDTYTFTRSGVDGKAVITDGKVVVDIKLGLLLSALAGMIESELRSKLQEGLP
jgi:putative polyhydroxyalkanoate system protein